MVQVPSYKSIKAELGGISNADKVDMFNKWNKEGFRLYTLMEEYGLSLYAVYTVISQLSMMQPKTFSELTNKRK